MLKDIDLIEAKSNTLADSIKVIRVIKLILDDKKQLNTEMGRSDYNNINST